MSKPSTSHHRQQENVNAYFRSQSSYWKDIYAGHSVQAEIYRARQEAVLSWIDEFPLAPDSHVLEIGCGAGFLAVALAKRGLRVYAIDSVEAMIEQTRQYAASEMAILLSVDIGDAHALAFEDGFFDLVIAIGVIPWLARPKLAMQEMARVTRPGGYIILTTDNRASLIYLLDPWLNPVLAPVRKGAKKMLKQVGLLHGSSGIVKETLHDSRFIDAALTSAGLRKVRDMTLGFGPFSFLRYCFIPEPFGTRLHSWLQSFANRKVPILRTTGAQYLVMATKSTYPVLM